MSMVKFATLCDKCLERRSREYEAWPTCRECLDHVCPTCQVPGTATEDERHEALCKECSNDLVCTEDCGCEHNCRCCDDRDCPRHGVDGPFAFQVFPVVPE